MGSDLRFCDPCPRLMIQLRVQTVRVPVQSARYPLRSLIAGGVWLHMGEMAAAVEAAAGVPALPVDTKLPILKEI